MEGTLEGGTTTSESIQTTPAFQDWNSSVNIRRLALQRNRPRERIRTGMTGGLVPETSRASQVKESYTLSISNGRNFGGRNDNLRIDPKYDSFQDLEFRTPSKGYGVT